jgi:hypothetical protein
MLASMNRSMLAFVLIIVAFGCARKECDSGAAPPVVVMVPPCPDPYPSTPPAPTIVQDPPAASDAEQWEIAEVDDLVGTWVHLSRGDSHQGGKINEGGVRLEIRKQQPPLAAGAQWALRFWAPRKGHMTASSISGGCEFYERVHEDSWRTAFCGGYGLVGSGHELKLVLDRSYDGDKVHFKLVSLLDELLVRPR